MLFGIQHVGTNNRPQSELMSAVRIPNQFRIWSFTVHIDLGFPSGIVLFLIRFADDHGMPLFETSAKDDSKADHVEAIFLTLAHKVRNKKTLFTSGTHLFSTPITVSVQKPDVHKI